MYMYLYNNIIHCTCTFTRTKNEHTYTSCHKMPELCARQWHMGIHHNNTVKSQIAHIVTRFVVEVYCTMGMHTIMGGRKKGWNLG